MAVAHCQSCRNVRNLCRRLARAGKATNMRFSPCASCRDIENARRSQAGPRPRKTQAIPPDEQMVYRLLGGPDPSATRGERQLAMRQLLAVRPSLTYHQISERVGVSTRTVERHASALRRGTV